MLTGECILFTVALPTVLFHTDILTFYLGTPRRNGEDQFGRAPTNTDTPTATCAVLIAQVVASLCAPHCWELR